MSSSLWSLCSLPGSSVHGILQARILEWIAIPFSRGSSRSTDQIQVSCIAGRFFTLGATKETFPLRDLTAKFVTAMSSFLWEIGKEEISPHRMIYMYTMHLYPFIMAFPGGLEGKESACNAGDLGLIPGLGRSFREGNGYPLQYSCLENSKDRGAWQATVHGVTKSWTWLSN